MALDDLYREVILEHAREPHHRGHLAEPTLAHRGVNATCGDEIALSFDATAAPAPPKGWTRTFLLHVDGFSKEMDLHSASPDLADPLPFHGMQAYPYSPADGSAALRRNAALQERYNTRLVARPLWPLELARGAPPR